MEDGYNAIIIYINQFHELAVQFHQFLIDYIWNFWFLTMGPDRITVYNQEIRTNNFVESYHSSLLRLIKPHPKIWEFLSKIFSLTNLLYIMTTILPI